MYTGELGTLVLLEHCGHLHAFRFRESNLLMSLLNIGATQPAVPVPPAPAGEEPIAKPDDTVENVFGSLAEIALDPKAPLISRAEEPTVIEHYRRLRTRILQEQAAKPFRNLLVTSPNPQEGKTLTVLNLGLSLAMLASEKVLIIDGDLRRGSLSKCVGADGRPGLSNLFDGSCALEAAVLRNQDTPLHFMTRGTSPIAAGELLQSCDLKSRFQNIAGHFSIVLVDSPPANLIADVQLLASACDAVLLIARAFVTSRKSFEKAAHDVSKFRVIGTVLNGGQSGIPYYRYRNYY